MEQALSRLTTIQRLVDRGIALGIDDRAMVAEAAAVVDAAVTTPRESAAMIARLRAEGVV